MPNPGASEGLMYPSFGIGMPGIGQTSSNGIPGSLPIQNSATGYSGIAIAKCWPHGVAAAAWGTVIIPAASPIA